MLNPAPLFFAGFLLSQNTPQYREAANAAAQAYYVQSGLQDQVNVLQDRYTPDIVKEYSLIITTAYRVGVDKKIEFSWTF